MRSYQKIKAIADGRGISICQIEQGAGLGNGTISGWDAGTPRVANLKKVAEFLEVPLMDIVEDDDDPPKPRNIERYGLRA